MEPGDRAMEPDGRAEMGVLPAALTAPRGTLLFRDLQPSSPRAWRCLREPQPPVPQGMAVSERVQQILTEVRELTDEENAQLETELLAKDAIAERAWGDEI